MNGKESERKNAMHTCKKESNKDNETLRTYGNKGEEKTPSTSEKKQNHVMVMLVYVNAVNLSVIECMNAHAKQQLYIPVIWKNFCQSKI